MATSISSRETLSSRTDSFGIKNGRRGSLGWFFLIGNCKSDNRSDAEEEMMKLVETAELL